MLEQKMEGNDMRCKFCHTKRETGNWLAACLKAPPPFQEHQWVAPAVETPWSAARKVKVYLAGPMRGIPAFNFPAFDATATKLRALGHEVFNPADNDREMEKRGEEINIRACLGYDMAWICKEADAIALLPGWRNSAGATAEHATAVALGLVIIELGAS